MNVKLEGLVCADCANQMETRIGKLAGVRSAAINFASSRLSLELEPGADKLDVLSRSDSIVRETEASARIADPRIEATGKSGKALQESGTGKRLLDILGARSLRLPVAVALFALSFLPFDRPLFVPILGAAAWFIAGADVVFGALRNLVRGRLLDETFLMSLATICAFVIGEYREAAGVMMFYQLGALLEEKTVERSRKSIAALMAVRPETARVRAEEGWTLVTPSTVAVGSTVQVLPGERVPLDGVVRRGSGGVDTSALTGESLPRTANPGDELPAGVVNLNGVLEIETTRTEDQSAVARILRLVDGAASKKAKSERFVTRFARVYTPIVVGLAAALALLPPIATGYADFQIWLHRALVFLVVSCPCALVLSIPLGVMGGIGAAARRGILVKGGVHLEALGKIDTVVFDKTGTLTKGSFDVEALTPHENATEAELLRTAAVAEASSAHPLARAVIARTGAEGLQSEDREVYETPGLGVRVRQDGREYLAGNCAFLKTHSLACADCAENRATPTPAADGASRIHAALDRRYMGFLSFRDGLKDDAAAAVADLKSLGIRRIVMLSGDRRSIGEAVGRELGIDEVHAELLPEDKASKLAEIRKTAGGLVAFVGDGINDAPVIALADVGVAMGGLGSDAAVEAADVILMSDEPSRLADGIRIARRTRKIVMQNIALAIGFKVVFLALGITGLAGLWEAVFADVGVALLAVLNSMRTLRSVPAAPSLRGRAPRGRSNL